MSMHYLFMDTETGGTNAEVHTLLTAYFAICDKDLVIIDDLELQLKPEDVSQIKVEMEAMQVNKIDLQEHLNDPNTVTYAVGKERLKSFLQKHKIKGKRKSYMPAGHNVAFDKDFIWAQLIPQEEFEETVHYRTVDTSNITTFLKDVEILPEDVGNLVSLVEHFNIPKLEAHNAKGDVRMNIEVYRAMKGLIKGKKKDMIGSNTSLLEIIEG